MKLVILESPYAGATPELRGRNVEYARNCLRDSLMKNEAPIASHLLYTQEGVLDDLDVGERERGIQAGLAWLRVADLTAVYVDFGISRGMEEGIEAAKKAGVRVQYRNILRGADRI
jgi:hypothetical protein